MTYLGNNISIRKLGDQSAGEDEYISFDDSVAVNLSAIPIGANWAVINLECDDTDPAPNRCAMYRVDGGVATDVDGTGLGDNESRDVLTLKSMQDLSIIGIEGGKTHELKVQYFR